jgi:hypothetical protein
MNLSEDRLSHLASIIIDGIWNDDLVDYEDEDVAMRIAKKVAALMKQEQTDVDEKVKAKIASLKRNVIENTPEWDVMYGKYYEEEMKRRGTEN